MGLDALTVSALTAVVVLVSGTLFTVDTFLRRDETVGRMWALSFLAGMVTSICYIIWAFDRGAVWPIALGNAAFVISAGCMWLGCRRFNDRRMRPAGIVVAGGGAATLVAALIDHVDGDWAGAATMFVLIALFAGLGSYESFTREMRARRGVLGLTGVLAVECLFYAARAVVFLTLGSDSEVFRVGFSTEVTSIVTVVLTIVALLTTSMLRAGLAPRRGAMRSAALRLSDDGILPHDSFEVIFEQLVARAQARRELVGVVSVRVDDLLQITTAYGRREADAVAAAWRTAVRSAAPTQSVVGDDGSGGLAVTMVPSGPSEARAVAVSLRDAVFDGINAAEVTVLPIATVGTAISSRRGVRPVDLVAAARATATETGADVIDVAEIGQSTSR